MRKSTLVLFLLIILSLFSLSTNTAWAVRAASIGNLVDKGLSGENVTGHGALGDGSTDDKAAIGLAHTAATVTGNNIIFPPGTYRVSSNITFDNDTTLVFLPGAKLLIDTGVTVTINAKIFPLTLHQIFSWSGTGVVVLASGSCEHVLPQWWGAVPGDSVDCSVAFNAALAAAYPVGKIVVPAGVYKLTTPIIGFDVSTGGYYTHRGGPEIIGAGMESTVLKYYGTSGYAIEVDTVDDHEANAPTNVRISNLHIQAPNITSSGETDSGGGILAAGVNGFQLENVAFTNMDNDYAYAIHCRGRNVVDAVTATARDRSRDFGTTGGSSDEKYALKFTAPFASSWVKQVTVRLGVTGTGGNAPAGTVNAYVYSDSSGPDVQVGEASDAITINTISTDADGEDVTFTWTLHDDKPPVTATDFWLVLETTGYTYADGVTELRLVTDEDNGSANTISTYDAAWSFEGGTNDDGYDLSVLTRRGGGVNHRLVNCRVFGGAGTWASVCLKLEGVGQCSIEGGYYKGIRCIVNDRRQLWAEGFAEFASSNAPTFDLTNNASYFNNCYFEGGGAGNPSVLNGGSHTFENCNLGLYLDWDTDTEVYIAPGCYGPLFTKDDATFRDKRFTDRIYTVGTYQVATNIGTSADSDALDGNVWELDAVGEAISLWFSNSEEYHYTFLVPGTYMFEVWAKDSNHLAGDIAVRFLWDDPWVHLVNSRFTGTANFEPYRVLVNVLPSQAGTRHILQVAKTLGSANTIYISHIRLRYLGPGSPDNNVANYDVIAYNPEQSDGDGSRESQVVFIGDRVAESLNERDFVTHAKWGITGDFDDTGGNAAYSHAGGAGTLEQTVVNMLWGHIPNRPYSFTYTVSGAAGDPTAQIDGGAGNFASANTALTLTNGTHTTTFTSVNQATKQDFTISASSDSGDDTFTLDDVSLTPVGASQSVLASIVGSHDGAVADEKGKMEFKVNLTSDGFSPTTLLTLDGNRFATLAGKLLAGSFGSPQDVTVTREYGAEFHYSGNDYNATAVRGRASLITTDASTRTVTGGRFTGAANDNIDASVVRGLYVEALGKADTNAATISYLIGAEINPEYEDENTITNYRGLYLRCVTDTDLPANTSYGIYLYNQQKGEGDGGPLTAGIWIGDNLSGGNDSYKYGIDMADTAGKIATADIRLQNGETIKNTTDGQIDLSGNTIVADSLVSDTYNFAADGEASDTYIITLDPVPGGYVTGMLIVFTATTANTGACTINVNGLGAKAIKAFHDQDPPDNYVEAGSAALLCYDGTNFQLLSPDANP